MPKSSKLADRLKISDLKALAARKVTNLEIAEKYRVSETYLSRVMVGLGWEKEPGTTGPAREAARKLFRARIEFRDKLAKEIIAGTRRFETACKMAGCTPRTMFRHVSKYREQARKGPRARR